MRLREVLLTLCLLACPLAQAQQPLSAESIRAAASAVAADPLMPGVEKTRRLRFKEEEKEKPKEPQNPARWWMDLLANLSTGLRVGMWLLGAGLLVWVLLRLREWLGRAGGARGLAPLPPTHVGTLDIRPQSLPDDIGGAARCPCSTVARCRVWCMAMAWRSAPPAPSGSAWPWRGRVWPPPR